MKILLIVVAAIIYANFLEWFVHKYLLHRVAHHPDTKIFTDHFKVHHLMVNVHKGKDPDYQRVKFNSEVQGLMGLAFLHLPTLWIHPVFYATLVVHAITYYLVHRQCHTDPSWGWKWFPWHMEHHRGREANWCVLFPLADYVFGTRYKYKK